MSYRMSAQPSYGGPQQSYGGPQQSYGAPGMASQSDNLPQEVIDSMQKLFGKTAGYRTTHAKGCLVEGSFTPTSQAKSLSTAAHFNNTSTPVVARFSVGGGFRNDPKTGNNPSPKGLAIRFKIDDDTQTDLIAHSFNGFATRTAEDYLTFTQLLKQRAEAQKNGYNTEQVEKQLQVFVKTHPSAEAFLNDTQPKPLNYGTITYYQPNTHILTNSSGQISNVRYRLVPADGDQSYTDESESAALSADYLKDDLMSRFPDKPIVFSVQAHVAGSNDALDDATQTYQSSKFVTVGELKLNKIADDNDDTQQTIAFSPEPEKGGVEGMKSSKDPLISARKGAYWISADQRRHERRRE